MKCVQCGVEMRDILVSGRHVELEWKWLEICQRCGFGVGVPSRWGAGMIGMRVVTWRKMDGWHEVGGGVLLVGGDL